MNTIFYELLYLAVAIATFEHTAWAAGTLFLGQPATSYFSLSDPIWLRGALVAISIDVGMLVVSHNIVNYVKQARQKDTKKGVIGLSVTFTLIAVGSFFAQLIFAYYHTPTLTVGTGVSAYWQAALQPLIEASPFILALMLPLIAVFYTISRVFVIQTEHTEMRVENGNYTVLIDGKEKVYKSEAGMNRAIARYRKQGKSVVIPTDSHFTLRNLFIKEKENAKV